jgi:SAM-dependent methyltransferase
MADIWTSTEVAENYAKRRPSIPQYLLKLLLATSVPHHRLAVDLGCGSASTASLLSASFDRVYAIDPSQDQLDAAPQGTGGLTYLVGDAANFRELLVPSYCHDGDVDLLCVGTALHWFSDPKRFLASSRGLLAPDGCLAIWTYFFVEFEDALAVTDIVRGFTIEHLHWWPEQVQRAVDSYVSLLPLFDESNYKLVHHGTESSGTTFESIAEFIGYTRTWSGIIRWGREDANGCDAALVALSAALEAALGQAGPLRMVTPHQFWIWRPSRVV